MSREFSRLLAVVTANQPLPGDVARWVFSALSDSPTLLRERNARIRRIIRDELAGSPWRRCNRFLELIDLDDSIVADVLELGCNVPSHWRVIHRIAYGEKKCLR